MRVIIKKSWGSKPFGSLFAMMLAFGAAATAQATAYYWTGNSDRPNNFNVKVNWEQADGTKLGSSGEGHPGTGDNAFFMPSVRSFASKFTETCQVNFYAALTGVGKVLFKGAGTAAAPIILNGTQSAYGLTVANEWVISDNTGSSYVTFKYGTFASGSGKDWLIGDKGSGVAGHIVVSNGVSIICPGNFQLRNGSVYVAGSLTANQIQMGGGSGRTATLTIEGGTVTNSSGACYVGYASGATGTLNLNEGGTLVTRNLYRQNDGTATVVFNGGTLKAKSAYANYGGLLGSAGTMTVTVGEKGGTIDCGGFDVLVSNALGTSGDIGGMTFKGGSGNTVTIANAVNYAGKTTVELGTSLHYETAEAIALGGGLAVVTPDVEPEENAKFTVLTVGAGTVPDSVVDSAVVPKECRLYKENDQTVVCKYRKSHGLVLIVK